MLDPLKLAAAAGSLQAIARLSSNSGLQHVLWRQCHWEFFVVLCLMKLLTGAGN